MEPVSQSLQNTVIREKLSFDLPLPADYEQYKVDSFKEATGDLDKEDGYNCQNCKNKGLIMRLSEENGEKHQVAYDCKCMPIRKSILRMKRSGLKDVIHDCTFDKWIATEDWQKTMKNAAVEYAKDPKGWFFIGGQSGCGKTHLCSAICREFLLNGKEVQYMQWREESKKLKGAPKDTGQHTSLIDGFKQAEVLYIDDLFKCGKNPDGSEQKPTSADIGIAFEIINYRYNKPASLTIISSELSSSDLIDIDEATGSRICERSKVLIIAKDKARNYRLKNEITL